MFARQTFLSGLLKDAANRRNPDATREKHRRSGLSDHPKPANEGHLKTGQR